MSELALASDAVAVVARPVLAQCDQYPQVVVFAEWVSHSEKTALEVFFELWESASVAECSAADPGYDLLRRWIRRSVPRGLNRRPQLSQSASDSAH